MAKRDGNRDQGRGIFCRIRHWLEPARLGEILLSKGLVSGEQLRRALDEHRTTRQPLGQVLVAQRVLSRRQVDQVLRRQRLMRCLTTCFLFAFSLSAAPSKKVRADITESAPMLTAVSAPAIVDPFSKPVSYPALFGTAEKRSGNLGPFTKWTGLFDRLDRQMQGQDSARVRDWQRDLQTLKGPSLKTIASRVNAAVNRTPYISDKKNWGRSDYWVTPADFLDRGGDCEDFAIAKYTALRMLGVPEERLRIAIVQDTQKNIPHALLIVYTEEGAYFLDNQLKQMIDAGRPGRYKPIFSINRQAWWLHTAPAATMMASAR